jgi:flagellar biogenesis protein FliO
MRSWMIVLAALFCLTVHAQETETMNEEELVKAAEAISKSDPTFNVVGAKTEAEVQAEEKAATTTTAATTGESATAITAVSESQIPLFPKGKTVEKAGLNPYWRVAASMVFIFIFGAGAIVVAKRRGYKRNVTGSTARIEVLHQHHFGPKRGLALVRVAGEVMLISMTDQNINMMKSVALIDDELPGLRANDFNNFLEDEFTVSSVQDALRAQV